MVMMTLQLVHMLLWQLKIIANGIWLKNLEVSCNNKYEPVYGSKGMSGMLFNLRAVQEMHTWHCKVSRISEGINKDNVRGYLS